MPKFYKLLDLIKYAVKKNTDPTDELIIPAIDEILLLDASNLNKTDDNGDTALIIAVKNKLLPVVSKLLSLNKIKVDTINHQGMSALMYAVQFSFDKENQNQSPDKNPDFIIQQKILSLLLPKASLWVHSKAHGTHLLIEAFKYRNWEFIKYFFETYENSYKYNIYIPYDALLKNAIETGEDIDLKRLIENFYRIRKNYEYLKPSVPNGVEYNPGGYNFNITLVNKKPVISAIKFDPITDILHRLHQNTLTIEQAKNLILTIENSLNNYHRNVFHYAYLIQLGLIEIGRSLFSSQMDYRSGFFVEGYGLAAEITLADMLIIYKSSGISKLLLEGPVTINKENLIWLFRKALRRNDIEFVKFFFDDLFPNFQVNDKELLNVFRVIISIAFNKFKLDSDYPQITTSVALYLKAFIAFLEEKYTLFEAGLNKLTTKDATHLKTRVLIYFLPYIQSEKIKNLFNDIAELKSSESSVSHVSVDPALPSAPEGNFSTLEIEAQNEETTALSIPNDPKSPPLTFTQIYPEIALPESKSDKTPNLARVGQTPGKFFSASGLRSSSFFSSNNDFSNIEKTFVELLRSTLRPELNQIVARNTRDVILDQLFDFAEKGNKETAKQILNQLFDILIPAEQNHAHQPAFS